MDTLIENFGTDRILDCLADSEAKKLEKTYQDYVKGLALGYRFFAGIGSLNELVDMLPERDLNALIWHLVQRI